MQVDVLGRNSKSHPTYSEPEERQVVCKQKAAIGLTTRLEKKMRQIKSRAAPSLVIVQ